MSALLQTGLGTGLWYVIPYGLGVRFAENALTYLFSLPPVGNLEIQIVVITHDHKIKHNNWVIDP